MAPGLDIGRRPQTSILASTAPGLNIGVDPKPQYRRRQTRSACGAARRLHVALPMRAPSGRRPGRPRRYCWIIWGKLGRSGAGGKDSELGARTSLATPDFPGFPAVRARNWQPTVLTASLFGGGEAGRLFPHVAHVYGCMRASWLRPALIGRGGAGLGPWVQGSQGATCIVTGSSMATLVGPGPWQPPSELACHGVDDSGQFRGAGRDAGPLRGRNSRVRGGRTSIRVPAVVRCPPWSLINGRPASAKTRHGAGPRGLSLTGARNERLRRIVGVLPPPPPPRDMLKIKRRLGAKSRTSRGGLS